MSSKRWKTPLQGLSNRPWIWLVVFLWASCAPARVYRSRHIRVLAFYSGEHDLAHISFDHDAHAYFSNLARRYHFRYDSTRDMSRMNLKTLSRYQVILFLDSRPEAIAQRKAFETYMKRGGAWMGFHFAAFGLTPSAYPMNWPWYHDTLLASGAYVSNTWRPTPAVLRVEDPSSPVMMGLPDTFRTAPNEWYRWAKDLRTNPDIQILASIDSSSFPLGTGPKPSEIWHQGYYPVVWTNRRYHMIYMNMGHNDMDYEHRIDTTNRPLSHTFSVPLENRLIRQALFWLAAQSHYSKP